MIRLDDGEIDLDSIPLDDEATYRELCAGNSIGVFQLESPGMREMMLSLQPTVIDDIAALVALYRPGPLGSGIDKMYINRKHGRERVTYAHPALEEVLGASYGVMLYQEDVLNVAKTLAGFSAAEADDLRKVMGKKLMDKVKEYREKFVVGCKETHNVPEAVANKVYSDIEYFAGYGFNRAHAFSYGMVSYLTAYLKTHYPVEYMAALMTSVWDDKDRLPLYLSEAKRLGLTVLPPSVNHSDSGFKVIDDDQIRFGLIAVSGIGAALVDQIVQNRHQPSGNLFEWMRETSADVLNKGTLEHLIRSGSLDELVDAPKRTFTQDEVMELVSLERQEIGVYLTVHPLENVAHILEGQATKKVSGLEMCADGEYVTVGGIISKVISKRTKRGDMMYILHFEDMTSSVEILVFPRDAASWEGKFNEHDIVLIEGRVAKENEESTVKLFFSNMTIPELPTTGLGRPIVLNFRKRPNQEAVQSLSSMIVDHPGDSPVYIKFNEERHSLVLRFNNTVDPEVESTLRNLGDLLDEPV